jgi:hypothetical protein
MFKSGGAASSAGSALPPYGTSRAVKIPYYFSCLIAYWRKGEIQFERFSFSGYIY